MTHITATPRAVIPLGRLGENEHTQIEFNVEQWQTEYPGCHFTLQNRRPEDETAYPVADATLDGSTLRWTVTSSALTQTGRGECELCIMLGDVVAKSIIYATIIGRALDGSGDVPDEWENWQTVFMSIKDDAETAADNAADAEAGADAARQAIEDMGVEADTLESGSDATVVKSVDPETGAVILTFGIPKGDTGATGERGERGETGETGPTGADGFSPIATVNKSGDTATITLTDKNGTTTASIADGQTGATGETGPAGEDGFSPIASVSKSGHTATITITDRSGTTTASVADGQTGEAGYSPTASVNKSGSTATISITDKNGTTTATISDGAPGETGPGVASGGTPGQMLIKRTSANYDTQWVDQPTPPVTDVQINSASVVSNGVANIPYGTSDNVGVVKSNINFGTVIQGGVVKTYPASDADIKTSTQGYRPIVPDNQHKATFYGLAEAAGDTTQSQSDLNVGTYTENAKTAIRTMIGAGTYSKPSGGIPANDIASGVIPSIPVTDVQVNGTSVLNDGVGNVPVAGASTLGVVKVGAGLTINSANELLIDYATAAEAKAGSNYRKAITPYTENAAAFYGLANAAGDSTQAASANPVGTYTDDAKTAIQQMLDVPSTDDIPDVPVQDVQVNGTSVVTDGVANVPLASANNPGVVATGGDMGLSMFGTRIYITVANDTKIKSGNGWYYAVTLSKQHLAAFYGLAKAAGADMASLSSATVGVYPEAQKSAISQMLNSPVTVTGTTPTITALPGVRYVCGAVDTLDITLPASGCIDVVFESGSTATALTITPPTGVTLKWANGFDPASLEANTTYEINICDGLGVAASWT